MPRTARLPRALFSVAAFALAAFALAAVGLVPLAPVGAQSARSGIRVEYTALDTQGGMSGRAFLPMSSRDVIDGAGAACSGALRIRATAKQTRGAVRQITLTLAARVPSTLPIRAEACPGAYVDTTLEDGSVLSGGRGEVVVTGIARAGRVPGVVTGTFAQTVVRNGTPVTIRGEFRIPLPVSATPVGSSSGVRSGGAPS